MDRKRLFDALKDRASMRVTRRLLAESGFPRGSGWDQIKAKLADKHVAAKANYASLENGLRELLVSTDKNVRLYELTPTEANRLRSSISNFKIAQNGVFATDFPYPVQQAVLSALPPQPAIPVAKFHGQYGTGVLYSSINVIELRERIFASQLGARATDYDEIIGIKRIKFQTFDAIFVSNSKNYAYVLTDAHHDTTNSTRTALQSNMFAALKGLAGTVSKNDPVNLLPFISNLYNTRSGAVKRLHYTTTTSSGKQEWMRGSGNCLRDELSHKAGMTALSGGFQGYDIQVEYPRAEVNGYTPRPTLEITGFYRMTYEINPRVEDLRVMGCANIAELEGTISELMLHVSGTKSL